MILNMSGGGSNPLNFKVVGGTVQPENPKENTVWIDTDAAISGWEFSAAQPESPAEGMVWICTGTESPVEFNALKKNTIQVCPLRAQQYVSDAWVNKSIEVYQGGTWKPPVTYLFNKGDQNTALTGGWAANLCSISPYTGNGGSTSAGSTLKIVAQKITGTSKHGAAIFSMKNAIDLTNVKTITVKATVSNGGWGDGVGVSTTRTAWDSGGYWNTPVYKQLANGTTVLDVSKLTGAYYLLIGTHSTSYDVAVTINVSEVYME